MRLSFHKFVAMIKKISLVKGLVVIGLILGLGNLSSCGDSTEDPHTLSFKQKEADSYVAYLATKPDSAGLRLLTAQKLDSVGRYEASLLHIDTLIQEDSSKYGLWLAKGNVLLDSGDTIAALGAFDRALSRYRGEEALLAIGKIYAAQQNDTALAVASSISTNPVYENYIKGYYYAQKGNQDSAGNYLDKSLHADPGFLSAYSAKAKLLLGAGKVEAAHALIKEGLRQAESSYELLNLLAASYEKSGQPDSAKRYYQQSLRIKPFQPIIQDKNSGTK